MLKLIGEILNLHIRIHRVENVIVHLKHITPDITGKNKGAKRSTAASFPHVNAFVICSLLITQQTSYFLYYKKQ